MPEALFVLGTADPEMHAIEELLAAFRVPFVHAVVGKKHVYPANAYQASMPPAGRVAMQRGAVVYLVECIGNAPRSAHRIDHHRPGDTGYGKAPGEFWTASSLGQTVAALGGLLGEEVVVTPTLR